MNPPTPQPYIKKPYERVRQTLETFGETRVDTSFGNDTDVNTIIARCTRTGEPLPGNPNQGQYVDVTGLQKDLTELVNESREALQKAEEMQKEYNAQAAAKEAEETAALKKRVQELESLQEQDS